ncbi:MAG TPA: ribonuclease P protein component [Candidatus Saccharimonadales bacterium]|nr:ribonuclease P protein component [Candidatus Saccharimonadales bacterium]
MLGRQHRFHGLGSLNFAYKQGQTVRGPLLSLKYAANPKRSSYRVAVVVSKKVSKSAVQRNRMRRRVYEALQGEGGNIKQPYDLVFTVFSDQVMNADFSELQKQVRKLLSVIGNQ